MDLIPLKEWISGLAGPLIIAGPCGAESQHQLFTTAKAISETGKAHILRAGIWKPRTRPDTFEGMGEQALPWLADAAKNFRLLSATEVANPRHVESALKHDIDILWIGARTTVNPFYVQEIASALKGTGQPVMIKNPVNPDLHLWIGAIERLYLAGCRKLLAIHRGFTNFSPSRFRNNPHWDIAIELKRLIPELPVVCDVSHIAGNRELIPLIAQRALDLDMQGLMIETHINPDEALSDARQQITPSQLNDLINRLVVRKPTSENAVFRNTLEDLRRKIDSIDHELIQVLAARIRLVEQIGEYKKENHVTVLQLERWVQILKDRIPFGQHHGLDPAFVRNLYELIHNESLRLQNQIMNENKHPEQILPD